MQQLAFNNPNNHHHFASVNVVDSHQHHLQHQKLNQVQSSGSILQTQSVSSKTAKANMQKSSGAKKTSTGGNMTTH